MLTLRELPPELLHIIARFFARSVPEALNFAFLCRKFYEMMECSFVFGDLARLRWPHFPFSGELDGELPTSDISPIQRFALLYRAELSPEFSPLQYSSSIIPQEGGAWGAIPWWSGEHVEGGLEEEGETEKKRQIVTRDILRTVCDRNGIEGLVLGDFDPSASGGGEEGKKMMMLSSPSSSPESNQNDVVVPSPFLQRFEGFCAALEQSRFCEMDRLTGEPISSSSHFGLRPAVRCNPTERFFPLKNSWFGGRMVFYVRMEQMPYYPETEISCVLVTSWMTADDRLIPKSGKLGVDLPLFPSLPHSPPILLLDDNLGPETPAMKKEGLCWTQAHRMCRRAILSDDGELSVGEEEEGGRILSYVDFGEKSEDGISICEFCVSSDDLNSPQKTTLIGVRLDHSQGIPFLSLSGVPDADLPFASDFMRQVHEKLILWALDGVLALPKGLHFMRVIRFLLIFEERLIHGVDLSVDDPFHEHSIEASNEGSPYVSYGDHDRRFPDSPFRAPSEDEVYRRKFFYRVSWDRSRYYDSFHVECGEGLLVVSESGWGLEIHRRRWKYRGGYPLTPCVV